MCSVVGYIGKKFSRAFIMEGLARLEYRGYDSAGFACLDSQDNRIMYAKEAGRLQYLIEQLKQSVTDGFVSVGHTRWSTHGAATQENAHPHFDCEKKIAVVHNGIIENHHQLRKQLEEGEHVFYSQTDTEVVAHLFEALLISHKTFKAAVVDLVNHLEGAYALIMLLQDYPDRMVLIRKRSPLCIGIGDDEMFVASDLLAFVDKTNKVLFIPENSFAIIYNDLIELYNFDGHRLPIVVQEIAADVNFNEQHEYEHFMLKEIYEQKNSIHSTINFLSSISEHIWDYIGVSSQYVQQLNKLNLIGCGTSWHAARIAQFFFEHIVTLPTHVFLASEFRHMSFFPEKNSLYVALSQS
ncbi:MAG: isomerizing glutamine--fructose-6-phosphate transaminase, partial [Candidatus Babeliales bacterium]